MMERTFRAERFQDALADIKRELGPDAIILETKQVRPSGALGGGGQVEVRAVAHQTAASMGLEVPAGISNGVDFVERRLQRLGVPNTAAKTLANSVNRLLPRRPKSMTDCRVALTKALEEELIIAGPIESSRARTIALVGPTGVGKTTTIAKLAAQLALVDHRRIGMVSIDQYRIGATEQLQCFADLIGCPMHIAHDTNSLEIALRKLENAEFVLVDTAGRSPTDRGALANMAECLYGVQEPVEVQLCLPATTRDSELQLAIDRHAVLRPTKLISTKLDEALYHGSIIAAQVLGGLPLTYFTTGQCVPEDIERASAARLADLLCGEEI